MNTNILGSIETILLAIVGVGLAATIVTNANNVKSIVDLTTKTFTNALKGASA